LRLLRGALLLVLVSCKVEIPEDAVFACTEDADCAETGVVCLSGKCCAPAAEVCDGVDNDCDGQVDEELGSEECYSGPPGTSGVGLCKSGMRACSNGQPGACTGEVLPAAAEACNTLDDDCDAQVDEGFDLQLDDANCGTCGKVCQANVEKCTAGVCAPVGETLCDDRVDNEGDGQIDCADLDCNNRACGTGCLCKNSVRTETNCVDGINNDNDAGTDIDCRDPDCTGLACGAGCSCAVDGGKTEIDCLISNNVDEDGDGPINCIDPDCRGLRCVAAPSTRLCLTDGGTTGNACACNGVVNPGAESVCNDGLDNDCNGTIDCKDFSCNGSACKTDAGINGTCRGNLNCMP
jgi:hypothetical protein